MAKLDEGQRKELRRKKKYARSFLGISKSGTGKSKILIRAEKE